MDHRGLWGCSRVLEIKFCQQHLFPWSSFSFGSVWLFRWRYIYPSLSLASGVHERVREYRSFISAFHPFSAFRDCTFVRSFFSAFVRHEHMSHLCLA